MSIRRYASPTYAIDCQAHFSRANVLRRRAAHLDGGMPVGDRERKALATWFLEFEN